jgi:hypothetical protein
VRTLEDAVRAYLRVTGSRRRVLPVPIPGKTARAFREGALTCPGDAYSEIRWEEFLRSRLASGQRSPSVPPEAFADDPREAE